MGYRNYLYIVDKKKINKVRKMSASELWELVGGKTELDEDIDTPWIGDVLDKLNAEEFIELGKYSKCRGKGMRGIHLFNEFPFQNADNP